MRVHGAPYLNDAAPYTNVVSISMLPPPLTKHDKVNHGRIVCRDGCKVAVAASTRVRLRLRLGSWLAQICWGMSGDRLAEVQSRVGVW